MIEIAKYNGFSYRFENGPDLALPKREDIEGINCQLLIHWILEDKFGVTLPPDMKSKEIFEDFSLFKTIDPNEPFKWGDIFFFGRKGLTDYRRLHMASHTGRVDPKTEEDELIHANYIDGRVAVWPLSRFARYPRYAQLHGVRRLRLS